MYCCFENSILERGGFAKKCVKWIMMRNNIILKLGADGSGKK